ncbi:MAG: hypothetical protein WAU86_19965 [Oricola sp.]
MRGLYVFLAAIAGLVAGYAAGFAILYPLFTEVMGYRDMDGGIAMGVAFVFSPVVAIVGAIAAAVFVLKKTRRARPAGDGAA